MKLYLNFDISAAEAIEMLDYIEKKQNEQQAKAFNDFKERTKRDFMNDFPPAKSPEPKFTQPTSEYFREESLEDKIKKEFPDLNKEKDA